MKQQHHLQFYCSTPPGCLPSGMGLATVPLGNEAVSVGGEASVGAKDFTESTSPVLASLVWLCPAPFICSGCGHSLSKVKSSSFYKYKSHHITSTHSPWPQLIREDTNGPKCYSLVAKQTLGSARNDLLNSSQMEEYVLSKLLMVRPQPDSQNISKQQSHTG